MWQPIILIGLLRLLTLMPLLVLFLLLALLLLGIDAVTYPLNRRDVRDARADWLNRVHGSSEC